MLQRVQTIYMLASVIAILMLFLFPLATFQISEATFELTSLGLSSLTPEVPLDEMRWSLFIVLLVMLILPLIAIFMYKKQKLQLRMLIYTSVVDVLFYVLYYWFEVPYCEETTFALSTADNLLLSSSGLLPALMPLLSLFCNIMAMRGVMYDIALLSSADRLRSSKK